VLINDVLGYPDNWIIRGTTMSRLRKLGLGIIIGLVIILLLAYWYVRYLETKGIPNYGGEVELKGLTNEVKVYRDKYAIPHIFAKNEPDLYRAVGYCMAQDRLFQMDLIRRLTSGRLSEVIGEETIDVDHLMRALRIPEKSRKIYEMTDKCILQLTEAFCDGVNQYIDSNKDRLPIEFTILGYDPEKWEPEHAFNVVGYFSFDLSTSWDSEVFFQKVLQKVDKERVREILPDLPAKKEMNYPHFSKKIAELDLLESLASVSQMLKDMGLTVFYGSNNWAVSGRKSVTGKPILANDMHLGLNAPASKFVLALPHLKSACPLPFWGTGHTCTSTNAFASGFLQALIAVPPSPSATLRLRQARSGLCLIPVS
jgi:penicillin amidase